MYLEKPKRLVICNGGSTYLGSEYLKLIKMQDMHAASYSLQKFSVKLFVVTSVNILLCTLSVQGFSFFYSFNGLQVLEALTAKKCKEEFSQESLETLGDSFLKYITTQHLFSKYKHQHEGMLTKMKKNLISNAALCQLACSNNLVVLFLNLIFFSCLEYKVLFVYMSWS
jgi:hypothetical protein